MQALQEWLNDKKNQPIILGGLGVVVVLVLLIWFFLLRPSGGGDEMGDIPPSDATQGVDATTGMPAIPADPLAQPTGTEQAAAAPPADKLDPLEESREDPFRPVFGPKPPRTRMTFTRNLPRPDIRRVSLEPVVLGLGQEEETLPPQPQRRMAGLLKNDRVFAIIETEGRTSIVKPGDPIDENLVVDRILPDKVILRSTRLRTPVFIEVPKAAGDASRRESLTGAPGGPAGPTGPMSPMGPRPMSPAPGGRGMDAPPPPAMR